MLGLVLVLELYSETCHILPIQRGHKTVLIEEVLYLLSRSMYKTRYLLSGLVYVHEVYTGTE